jgi:hypothetical protein
MVSISSQSVYDFVSSIFFFIIINSSSTIYTGYTGNQLKKIISDSDLLRNIFLFATLWLIGGFVDDDQIVDGIQNNLVQKLIISSIVFVFILLFSRQTAFFNGLEMIILLAVYVLHEVRTDYYADHGLTENDSTAKVLENVNYGLLGSLGFFLIIGYYQYMVLKIKQKGKRFKLSRFMFGKEERDYGKKSFSTDS